jgi:hypothetical protein
MINTGYKNCNACSMKYRGKTFTQCSQSGDYMVTQRPASKKAAR